MHMLDPKELETRRNVRTHKQNRLHRRRRLIPALLTLLLVYAMVIAIIPASTIDMSVVAPELAKSQNINLPWPAYGQAAIGAVGYGLLAQHGDPKPLPIASVAKVLTALAVLKQRPIIKGQPTAMITISDQDVATYKRYVTEDQSVIAVERGEQISEYQALQALLLPSANNMADALVQWAFGSMDNYLKFANPFAKTIGMTNTTIADASGFSPQTTSTAVDLTKLAEIAMNNPVLAEIVGQAQADLPVAGTVYNVNKLVGHDGVVGIKTGNTDEAGGCYLFAVKREVTPGNTITLVGTTMGAGNLAQAISDAQPLIKASYPQFHKVAILQKNQSLGHLTQKNGQSVPVVSSLPLDVITWAGQAPNIQIKPAKIGTSVRQGDEAGRLEANVGSMTYLVPLLAAGNISAHSYAWKFLHAGGYL